MSAAVAGAVGRYLSWLHAGLEADATLVAALAAGSQALRVGRGESVCVAGSHRKGCYWLIGGKVKIALLGRDGGERVMDLVLPGGGFGETTVWADRLDNLCAEALVDSELLFIGCSAINAGIERSAAFARALMERMSAQGARLLEDLEGCCLLSAGERVERYLVQNVRRCERFLNKGQVQLPACKALVASSLNLSAETFSRELHRLAAERLVTIDRRTIHLHDIDALERRRRLVRAESRAVAAA
jgi:CRP-like cAMP-binding protein